MDVQRSADRFVTKTRDVTTLHSFSYGAHYDPDNIAFGPILAINEESVRPGAGYDAHHHADVEIVTWVLDGALSRLMAVVERRLADRSEQQPDP